MLLFVETARAEAAWAFAIPKLIDAKVGADVTAAVNERLFPHAQAGFVRNYQIDSAVDAIKVKLAKIYDDLLSKV